MAGRAKLVEEPDLTTLKDVKFFVKPPDFSNGDGRGKGKGSGGGRGGAPYGRGAGRGGQVTSIFSANDGVQQIFGDEGENAQSSSDDDHTAPHSIARKKKLVLQVSGEKKVYISSAGGVARVIEAVQGVDFLAVSVREGECVESIDMMPLVDPTFTGFIPGEPMFKGKSVTAACERQPIVMASSTSPFFTVRPPCDENLNYIMEDLYKELKWGGIDSDDSDGDSVASRCNAQRGNRH